MTEFSTDFFICHATLDGREAAHGIVADLEARDVTCWIAPRDIPLGDTWPQAIVKGIEASRAMLLVVTKGANNSQDVEKELALAAHLRKLIFPVRVTNVALSGSLLYHVQMRQWRDLFMDRESVINEIVKQIEPTRHPTLNADQPRLKRAPLTNNDRRSQPDDHQSAHGPPRAILADQLQDADELHGTIHYGLAGR